MTKYEPLVKQDEDNDTTDYENIVDYFLDTVINSETYQGVNSGEYKSVIIHFDLYFKDTLSPFMINLLKERSLEFFEKYYDKSKVEILSFRTISYSSKTQII